jgi:hypothetical protein
VAARHERGHLLVAYLDEFEIVAGTVQRAHDAVDTVAGIAVDAPDAPFAEAAQQEIADGVAHGRAPSLAADACVAHTAGGQRTAAPGNQVGYEGRRMSSMGVASCKNYNRRAIAATAAPMRR